MRASSASQERRRQGSLDSLAIMESVSQRNGALRFRTLRITLVDRVRDKICKERAVSRRVHADLGLAIDAPANALEQLIMCGGLA